MSTIVPNKFLTSADASGKSGELCFCTEVGSETIFLRNNNLSLSQFKTSDWAEQTFVSKTDIVVQKVPLVTGSTASTVVIDPYKMYNFGTLSTSMSVSFNTSAETSGCCAQYMFRFIAGNGCSLTLPNAVSYCGGTLPSFTTGRTYEINITDNLCVVAEFYKS